VNADVPSLKRSGREDDPHVNALCNKGVGEIGIAAGGAVANDVWHATGSRMRKFQITLDRLIDTQ
jgi:xanthine dehydrogenase YagR molybdenum-binding subunit